MAQGEYELPLEIAAIALLVKAIQKAEYDGVFADRLRSNPSKVLTTEFDRDTDGYLVPTAFQETFTSQHQNAFDKYFRENIILGVPGWIERNKCKVCIAAVLASALLLVALALTALTGDPTGTIIYQITQLLTALVDDPNTLVDTLKDMIERGSDAIDVARWLCEKMSCCPPRPHR